MGVVSIDISLKGLLGLFFLFCAGYYLVSTFSSWYRLRQFPGPFFASISYLWLARVAWAGKQYKAYGALTKQYGPLVRIGPDILTTDDPEVLRHISNGKNAYRKADWYDGTKFNPYHPIMFITKDPWEHDKLKAKLTPGYAGRDTSNVESAVDSQLSSLIDLVRAKYLAPASGDGFRPLDLARVVPFLTLDIISRIALGEEFGCLRTDSDRYGFYSVIEAFMPKLCVLNDVPWLSKIFFSNLVLKLFGPRETDSVGMGKIMALSNNAVRERLASGKTDEQDILGSFLRHGLSQIECEVELPFMFTAGAETTASTMRNTMLYVITTPLVYRRLKEEIEKAVRGGKASSPITQAEAKELPYLQAVIFEGLRMRPVTTGLLPKAVPPEGDTIHGKFVPGGTAIAMNMASLQRSKALFGRDADIFRPERFLELDEGARAEMQRNVELTFGYGRWMCAGKRIAHMELSKTYFELLRHFDFQVVNPQTPMTTENFGLFLDKTFLVRATSSTIAA